MSEVFDDLMQGLNEVEAYLKGESKGYRVHVPESVDVKKTRGRLKMTQAKFADTFGFSLDAIKHWEGERRQPEVSARAYLTVIAKEPKAVMRALGRAPKKKIVRRKVGGETAVGKRKVAA
jgi:putative transcriptional regulator